MMEAQYTAVFKGSNGVAAAPLPFFPHTSLLDATTVLLDAGRVTIALDDLFADLASRRIEEPGWPEYARFCTTHPLHLRLQQDPFTQRAYVKPRGYAGDAVMMDYIYGLGEAGEAARRATSLGRAIFQYIRDVGPSRAVRYRRELLAKLIDRTAEREEPRVLAIASGHLREVELSQAVLHGSIAEFLALDQDEASLEVVARDYSSLGVTPRSASVRHILGGKAGLVQYDLVYAAGLFDYLNDSTAKALTRRMFEATRAGGTLLIPNFLPGIPEAGYMEAFMDWTLIYRTQTQMLDLAGALPPEQLAGVTVFNDPDDAIAFLLVNKKD